MKRTQDDQTVKTYIDNYFEGMVNLFLFFPYFFSVGPLLKTLFSPWKKIVTTKKRVGFSLSAWGSDIMFDLISRWMGFTMRSSILLFYLLIQITYIIFIPFLVLFLFVSIPFSMIFSAIIPSETDRKKRLKEDFIRSHLLQEVNRGMVDKWFEYRYDSALKPKAWWKLRTLMSTPPLARDWAMGYTPTLDKYTEELTDPSYQLDIRSHVIGRETETVLIERELSKSDESNVILVGEDGVGKGTIINLLAKKMYEGKSSSMLAFKRLLRLDMEKILNGETDSAKREAFVEDLLKEASSSGSAILFIDHFERYVSEGDGHTNLSIPFEKYAKTNTVQIIGTTTPFAYDQYIYSNTAIRELFAKIEVDEIPKEKALVILLDKSLIFEERYHVVIPYEVILTIIDKSNFFITDVPFPEKAIQLMDSVCVYTSQTLKSTTVLPETVDTVITAKTHVPSSLTDTIKNKLLHLEDLLKTQIIGQDEAIAEISSAMRRSFLLLGTRSKPLASFLFLGPTGVGKTETAKVISNVFFDSPEHLIRFDMSLYQSKSDIPKLMGSIQELNPGLLTNAIREHPYGILLLDEIEKAHPDLLNIFLTIIDEGYFTDGYGQRVDCKNLVIVATSNAGADHIHQMLLKQSMNGMQTEEFSSNKLIDYLVEHHLFSPEFLNRFDGVIAYKPITASTASVLAKDMIADITQTIYERYKIHVVIREETITKIATQGYDAQYGARNLERLLRQKLEDQIAKTILQGSVHEGDTITL